MKIIHKILLIITCFIVGFNPITVSAEDSTTVSIDVDSDYENVVVENENYTNVVHDKIVLPFSDVGEYKYKIYVPEDLNTSYTLTVVVGRNDSNQLYTETVLYNNANKDVKVDKVEFRKKPVKEEPKQDIPNQEQPKKSSGGEIATGVMDNSLMWGAIITLCAIALHLSREERK